MGSGTFYNKQACVPRSIRSTKFPYVIICSTSGLEKLCFGHKDHKDRLLFCNDARRRVCFNQGLSICKIPNFNEPKIRRRRIADLSETDVPRKPDVNCQNCEVDIKMFVREGEENATPKILINITDIDPVDVRMDDPDDDNDNDSELPEHNDPTDEQAAGFLVPRIPVAVTRPSPSQCP
ncbi:uncharacterized protein TNIN_256361 [Trichonephila inaurata madagascariensis]|uniref:Uncharacterized protein n=1 Tax=Trichonephila inaurata madagascariensis TaxID=2747483 RepID=A0A8X6XM19_9ARAC|nr:uncharacterized protein TNIN_256361 [Trichonephila inaurata madagascariensis]